MLMTGLDFDHSSIISDCTSHEDAESFHEEGSLEFVFDNDISSQCSARSEGESSQGLNMAFQLSALDFAEKRRSRTNSCCSSEIDEEEELSDGSSLEFIFDDDDRSYPVSPAASPTYREVHMPFQLDASTSYIMYQSRFREFMSTILQLTQWECAELWLVSKKPLSSELYVVTSIHKDDTLEQWSNLSRDVVLQKGEDLPGTVFETTKSKWDKHYSNRPSKKSKTVNPRADLASKLGMSAAFGIPVPMSSGCIGGVLALYSRSQIKPDQLLRSLVQKCVHLMIPCVSVCPDRSCLDVDVRESELLSEVSEGDEEEAVYENPYSFFCSQDESTPSSPVKDQIEVPQLDFSSVHGQSKNCTEISTIFDSIPKSHIPSFQQSLQGKRGWDQEGSTPMSRSSSMTEVPTPQFRSIFHSQSLNSLYKACSDIQQEAIEYDYEHKAKRARSIDLGEISNSSEILPYDYFAPVAIPMGNDHPMPKKMEEFNHLDMLWNSFMKPYSSGSDCYPYPPTAHYPNNAVAANPFQLPEAPIVDMPLSNPYNFTSSYENYSTDISDEQHPFSRVGAFPAAQCVPVAVPTVPILNSQVICQPLSVVPRAQKKESKSTYVNDDVFSSLDYVFKADFGLENDSYCAPDGIYI